MSEPISRKILYLIVHLMILVAIFVSLIFLLENKNTMILTMTSNSSHPLSAEIYYTKSGIAFNDNKVSHRDKVKGDKYYFTLPSFKEINYARLDPARHKRDISIQKNIQIIVSKWFTKTVYTADITKSEVGQQIKNYTIDKKGIKFTTTGKDPQLNINLTRTFQHASNNYHLDILLMSVLVYAVILFLYHLYRTEEFSDFLSAKLIIYVLFLGFSIFKVDYYKEHVYSNYTPDSIAHLSYIKTIHNKHEIIPKFENMYMITNKNAGNYLGHPPLYYYLMNAVYDKNYSVVGNIDNFRMINVLIFIASILLLLYIGFQTKMGLLAHLVYLTVITAIPMHAYLGSAISNDNLAILGGVIFAVGLLQILKQRYENRTYWIVGLGIFIGFFSKLTAGILIFFAGVFLIVYLVKAKVKLKINKQQVLILLLFIVPVLVYQGYILWHYHALAPTLNVTHPEEYKHSVYFVPEALRDYKTLFEWLKIYWHNIHTGWFGIHSHYSFFKLQLVDYIGLLLLHISAIYALFFICKQDNRAYCLLGKIGLLSLFSVVIVQFTFSYQAHLHSGYTGGLQPRYLLPFMFSFAIMASIFVDRYRKNFIFSVLILLISVQALYSDFFYFLKYYA